MLVEKMENLGEEKVKDEKPNRVVVIPLTQGKFAIIDEVDYGLVKGVSWCASKVKCGIFYAKGANNQFMHRFIMNPPDDMVIDHINKDALDNRRCNLRIVTHAANLRNGKYREVGFTGTNKTPLKRTKQWYAHMRINGEAINIGCFKTEQEAIACRKGAEKIAIRMDRLMAENKRLKAIAERAGDVKKLQKYLHSPFQQYTAEEFSRWLLTGGADGKGEG